MNQSAAHTALMKRIRLALGADPDVVLWPNIVTHIETYDAERGGARHGHAGLPDGSPDLVGIVFGRFIGLEVKTGSGQLRPSQVLFSRLVQKHGGFFAVVRSVEEAVAAIARAKAGATQ
jgi:hypothetical protein